MTIEDIAQVEDAPPESGERHISLMTMPTSLRERRLVIALAAASVLAFIIAVPFARVPLGYAPGFIASYESALAISDLITAILLFDKFRRDRSLALVALASGYLFDALITVVHALTFPGAYSPTGLLGAGEHTTCWLYIFWHSGFPIFLLGYVLLAGKAGTIRTRDVGIVITLALMVVLTAVVGLSILATAGEGLLPVVAGGSDYWPMISGGASPAAWSLILLALLALLALLRRRLESVLDLWVGLVLFVGLLDVTLSAIISHAHYDLGWYGGRAFGLLAAGFVLIALTHETNRLRFQLADAQAMLEDHARMLARRIRERTAELAHSNERLKNEIAERSLAEAQLVQAHKMQALGQLTGGLAHDFNNLLGIIIGNLDFLRDTLKDDGDVAEMLDEALDASLRGAELNRRLLAFARQQPLQPKRTDLAELVGATTKLLRRTLGEEIEIQLAIPSDLRHVVVDPIQLEAALTNLAVNARDAMPNGGRLSIAGRNTILDEDYASEHPEVVAGHYALLEVTDNGCGMTPEILKHVFEPFYTTKDIGEGTGLGLSMVFGFVKQSGGHVKIYSEPEVGTTVRIYLPSADKGDVEPVDDEILPAPNALANQTILVVEDNEKLRRVLIKQLKELGYAVLEATNGNDALDILNGEDVIDLLFTDVVMPGGMGGRELAQIASRIRPQLKILFTSGFPQASFTETSIAGASALLLSKPYRKRDLAQKLCEALAV